MVEQVTVEAAFELEDGCLAIVVARIAGADAPVRLSLPLDGSPPSRGLHRLAVAGGGVTGEPGGRLVGHPGPAAGAVPATPSSVSPSPGDQSHTSVILDDASILKLLRRLTPGQNPEAEVLAALAGIPGAPVPAYHGRVDYEPAAGPATTVALEQAFEAGAADAFESLADGLAAELLGGRAADVEVIRAAGTATGRLHRALAAVDEPGFRPRPATTDERAQWLARAEASLEAAVTATRSVETALGDRLARSAPLVRRALRPLGDPAIGVVVQRIHGDLHLGQVLPVADGLRIIDFEGDPMRDPDERRAPGPALADVAAFLRSIDHVARSARRRAVARAGVAAPSGRDLDGRIRAWIEVGRAVFLDRYAVGLGEASWRPDRALLRALEVEKEMRELAYAARYLPAWRYAPVGGIGWLLGPILEAAP